MPRGEKGIEETERGSLEKKGKKEKRVDLVYQRVSREKTPFQWKASPYTVLAEWMVGLSAWTEGRPYMVNGRMECIEEPKNWETCPLPMCAATAVRWLCLLTEKWGLCDQKGERGVDDMFSFSCEVHSRSTQLLGDVCTSTKKCIVRTSTPDLSLNFEAFEPGQSIWKFYLKSVFKRRGFFEKQIMAAIKKPFKKPSDAPTVPPGM